MEIIGCIVIGLIAGWLAGVFMKDGGFGVVGDIIVVEDNPVRRLSMMLAALFLVNAAHAAVPFWGDKASMPADTPPTALKQGQFVWDPAAAPSGPIVVVVSLTEQIAYVYRNGLRIGYTTVSTGKPGHETPTGVFTTLQKDKDHRSSIYHNAPMPYTQRLTWGGVSLHAGGLPGYPSSHGCVHLPSDFAQLLFDASPMGMTVVVANAASAPADVVHPAALSPVDAKTGTDSEMPRLSATEAFRWEPEKSPEGPVSVLMSAADQRVLVFRNGIEIGRAKIRIAEPEQPLGTHVFVVMEGQGEGPNTAVPGAPTPRWIAVGVPGYASDGKRPLDPAAAARVSIPPEFAKAVYPLLIPGTTMMVTDAAVLESTTGTRLAVVTNAPPPAKP